ncbi:hypothetical protein HDV00_011547 [Rhizophlyctis rosea]|nr:hypothetical protein HDV00_011547 [Rhizophlyctis rosea]
MTEPGAKRRKVGLSYLLKSPEYDAAKPIYVADRLKSLGLRMQKKNIGDGAATDATYDRLEGGGGVEFEAWAGRDALANSQWFSREKLKNLFADVMAVQSSEITETDGNFCKAVFRKFSSLDWKRVMKASTERDVEEFWLSVLDDHAVSLGLDTRKDRIDILLPHDFAICFSKPKPDFIAYLPAKELDNALYGFVNAIPIFTIGNKGGPKGVTIDAALPQDTSTTYAMAYVWKALGVPLDDVYVLSASTENGILTQFFVTFFSNSQQTESFTPAAMASTTSSPAQQSTPSSPTGGTSGVSASALAQALTTSSVRLVRHLVVIPITKKLVPSDLVERVEMSRMYQVLGKHVAMQVAWFKEQDRLKGLWQLRAAAELPTPEEDEEDEYKSDLSRSETLTEEKTVEIIK